MKGLWGLLIVIWVSGCASKPTGDPFHTRIYNGTYDEVWTATLKVLNDYPLKLNNKDTGRISTETINGPYNDLLFSPMEPIDLPERFRYSMQFNLARLGDEDKAQTGVRIRIVKDLEKFHDFYTGWLAYPSDGLEERLILYRIEHLLRMERLLAKAAESSEAAPQDAEASDDAPQF